MSDDNDKRNFPCDHGRDFDALAWTCKQFQIKFSKKKGKTIEDALISTEINIFLTI